MMTYGHGQSVRSIEVIGLLIEFQYPLQHLPYLLLVRITVAGDGLLDLFRGIFRYAQTRLHGRSDGNALRPSQLQHALHVLPEERCFNSAANRFVLPDDAQHPLLYRLQPLVMVFLGVHFQHVHFNDAYLLPRNGDQSVTHNDRTGIYTENYFCIVCQAEPIFAKTLNCLNKSTKIILNYVLGGALCIWLTYAIYQQVQHQQNLPAAWEHMKETVLGRGWALLLLVLAMMFVNWGIEARKWQLLVKPLEEIPFKVAFGAILSGVSLSVNTPNRIGEYGGRILYLRNPNKLKAIAATIVGSFSQLIITAVFGIIGFVYYLNAYGITGRGYFSPGITGKLLLGTLIVICALGIILYFRLRVIVSLVEKIPWLRKIKVFIQIIARYSPAELEKLLLLSTVRYMVFSAQYLILLYALGVSFVWWQGFFMVNVIYVVMAVLPTIAIAEIGLRGSVSLHFLGLLSGNTAGILAATVAIWLINLVLPAAIGSILLLGVKIFKDK